MPHSWPATTSRTSSLKRLSCDSLPSWITTLSRIRRTPPPAPPLVGRACEPENRGARRFGERDVGFGNAADAGMDDPRGHLFGAELFQRAVDGLERALHVRLDDKRGFLA